MDSKIYQVKRTVIECYFVDASSKKEALQIVGDQGGPSKVIVKSERVEVAKNHRDG